MKNHYSHSRVPANTEVEHESNALPMVLTISKTDLLNNGRSARRHATADKAPPRRQGRGLG